MQIVIINTTTTIIIIISRHSIHILHCLFSHFILSFKSIIYLLSLSSPISLPRWWWSSVGVFWAGLQEWMTRQQWLLLLKTQLSCYQYHSTIVPQLKTTLRFTKKQFTAVWAARRPNEWLTFKLAGGRDTFHSDKTAILILIHIIINIIGRLDSSDEHLLRHASLSM